MRGSIPATIIFLASAWAGRSQVLIEPCFLRTDREVHPPPVLPELPSAGGVFRDPIFCTSILRVTDERDGRYFQIAYSSGRRSTATVRASTSCRMTTDCGRGRTSSTRGGFEYPARARFLMFRLLTASRRGRKT